MKKYMDQGINQHFFLSPYRTALIIAWTLLLAVSVSWNLNQAKANIAESARIQARVALEKDIIYRRWNAGHGGVYVPATDETGPNPYLKDVRERDIKTSSGKLLTLMNPAYMTRQAHELAEKEFGVRGHITSLKPIRPDNAADPWERAALNAFEQGETEISAIKQIDGRDYMRLMKPLVTEKGCLKCHAQQGYTEGDIRGGISVSVPMDPLWAVFRSHAITLFTAHFLLWLTGIGGIAWGSRRIRHGDILRSKAEAQIKNAEQEWRYTFDSITDYVSVLDTDYKIIKANRAFADFLMTTPDNLIGMRCYEVVHGLDHPLPDCPYKKMLQKQKTVTQDIFDTKSGRYLMITASPLFENGELKGSVHFIKDITERRHAEAELEKHRLHLEEIVIERTKEVERSNEQLRAAVRELESFSYSISHDLKAPIRAIGGFSKILLEDYSGGLNDEGKRIVNVIHSNVDQMRQLIDDILKLSRMSQQPLKKSNVDIQKLATDIFEEIKKGYPGKTIHFHTGTLPSCYGDPVMIRQILTNLISNAAKFTKPGEVSEVEIGSRQIDKKNAYFIKDNGVGFDMKYANKLFSLFHRLHSKKEYEGTGVGLAIVQRLIHMHNGQIWAESNVNEGTTFYFTL